jgi:glutamine cyclotransferase
VATACRGPAAADPFVITAVYPHDSTAYTQGLVAVGDTLYESTGLYGHSDVRRVDLRSGRVLAAVPLAGNRFGEGLALLHGRLYQLTWKEGVGYVYSAKTLARVDSFHYAGEGWGLATDGTSLIMSDGSDSLQFLSPVTFRIQRVVHVRSQDGPVNQLNELELVNGDLFANIYRATWIARIDPATGGVRELLDFTNRYPLKRRPISADVMNGIAAADSGKLLLTGKDWPYLFEVRLRTARALGS